jgi:peptidoglycan/LPS O-acetylase OafA/YrhL
MPLFLLLLVGRIFKYAPPGYPVYIGVIASMAFIEIIRRASVGFPGMIGRIFENRLLVHIGRMSYSIFLLHEFTELLIPRIGFFGPLLDSNYRMLVLIPATILLSHLAWVMVEAPVLSFRKRYTTTVPARRAWSRPVAIYFNPTPTSSTVFPPLRFESTHRETTKPAVVSAS